MTNPQFSRKSRTFSLTDAEMNSVLARAKYHGFDRNEYVLALLEADELFGFEVALNAEKRKVLRPRLTKNDSLGKVKAAVSKAKKLGKPEPHSAPEEAPRAR